MIYRENTTSTSGVDKKEVIEGHCTELCKQIEKAISDYDREKLQDPLAKLAGGARDHQSKMTVLRSYTRMR